MTIRPNGIICSTDDASRLLDLEVSCIDFEHAKIHVLVGYPQSDIGKAHLIARLGFLLGHEFSILKFDGFLNTNLDGRYPSRTDHDFVVYRKFHEHIGFGGFNQILGGPFLIEFLTRFGESKEHLMFRPHVAKFFARRVFDNWIHLGKPQNLLVEIGGTFLDYEVNAYVVPAIRLLQGRHEYLRTLVLTEAGYNGQVLKTRPVVSGLEMGQRCGLVFDLAFVRMPANFPPMDDYAAVNAYIERKIDNALVWGRPRPKIICIPFYRDSELHGYLEYLSTFREVIFPSQ
jgi:CTP synthase (UTP-ammonia lyase)